MGWVAAWGVRPPVWSDLALWWGLALAVPTLSLGSARFRLGNQSLPDRGT